MNGRTQGVLEDECVCDPGMPPEAEWHGFSLIDISGTVYQLNPV